MKAYIAFTKKEFCEMARTYKLLTLGAVFFLFGMLNPLTAKLMPLLLESLVNGTSGITVAIVEPTAIDSWTQFFKNIPQMGLIVMVIVYSGVITNELSRGTLVNMLTKGLARRTVILAKFTATSVVWSASYWLCFAVSYLYTWYFWRDGQTPNLLFAVFCLWLFGLLLIAALLFGGVCCSNSYGSLLFTGAFDVTLLLLNISPSLAKYNPIALASSNMALLTGQIGISDLTYPLALSVALTATFIAAAILLFNRKQI